MTTAQIQAVRQIVNAIVEAIKAAGPLGAPGGVLYAGLMTQGCSLSQFESLMTGIVKSGMIVKRGECYHIAKY